MKANEKPGPRTADRVYEDIRRGILSGRLVPGERITEALLAERFNASRTPVRSAIVRLESDGFVETKPRSGTVVKTRSPGDIADIYDVRAILESAAAGLAAKGRSAADLDDLTDLQTRMEDIWGTGQCENTAEAPNAIEALSSLNKAFHQRILAASQNATLVDAAARLMDIGFLINTYVSLSRGEIARAMGDHRNLIAAITSRDAEWAEAIMRGHILGAKNALTKDEMSNA